MLRRIFGPKREEVAGGLRRLHYEKLHNLYTPSNIIRVNKSGRVTADGHVACTRRTRNAYGILLESFKEKDLLEYLGIDRKIT
jgi:hypothetical protein